MTATVDETHLPVKRALEIDDLFALRFVAAADVTPDGRTVAFAETRFDGETGRLTGAVSVFDADRPDPVEVARGHGVGGPSWSPDGSHLAFLAPGADGRSQVFIRTRDGSDTEAVTALPRGVAGTPAWSPDGSLLAFQAPPQDPPRDPSMPFRVTRPIYRMDTLGYLDDTVHDIYVVAATGGTPTRLTADGWMNTTPLWSPDGNSLLYTASFDPTSHQPQSRFRLVGLDGTQREISDDDGTVFVAAASFLPDGRVAYVVLFPKGQPPGSKGDLWVVDPADGRPECRTRSLAVGVGGILQPDMPVFPLLNRLVVSADGAHAYVPVQDGGANHVYRVALDGEESWECVVGGERSSTPLALEGERLLLSCATMASPPDLVLVSTATGEERRLTDLNADVLGAVELPLVDPVSFTSVDGQRVEGWFLHPPSGQVPFPTVLSVHGGPHVAWGHTFSFEHLLLTARGYGVLLVNYRGSSGYGTEFATAVHQNLCALEFEDLMGAVDHVVHLGLADGDRLAIRGGSNGGTLSCWAVGHTDRFRAAIPEAPVTNWATFYGGSDGGVWGATAELGGSPQELPEVYARCSAITYAPRCRTPTLLVHHELDYRCPADQVEQFYTALKVAGCTVEMLRVPESSHGGGRSGHSLRARYEAVLQWFDRFVTRDRQ